MWTNVLGEYGCTVTYNVVFCYIVNAGINYVNKFWTDGAIDWVTSARK